MVSVGYFTDKVVWEGSFSSKAVRASNIFVVFAILEIRSSEVVRALSTFVVFVGYFRNEAAEVMNALIIFVVFICIFTNKVSSGRGGLFSS